MVEEIINDENIRDVRLIKYGYPDEFIKHGNVNEIERKYGLDAESLAKEIENKLEACV